MQEKPVVTATLHRWGGEYKLVGNFLGVAMWDTVTVQKVLVLSADSCVMLELMVDAAAVDGWHRNGSV